MKKIAPLNFAWIQILSCLGVVLCAAVSAEAAANDRTKNYATTHPEVVARLQPQLTAWRQS